MSYLQLDTNHLGGYSGGKKVKHLEVSERCNDVQVLRYPKIFEEQTCFKT